MKELLGGLLGGENGGENGGRNGGDTVTNCPCGILATPSMCGGIVWAGMCPPTYNTGHMDGGSEVQTANGKIKYKFGKYRIF